ncbi:MAG: hypothetical protein HZB15_04295, partial [Actinobacteria bacterium]|nr:hypothetical protein [Actinomycetota bacterium]
RAGSRLDEFPDLIATLQPESCDLAWGEHSGVLVRVIAREIPFLEVDADGREIPQSPDPATLVVVEFQGGYIGGQQGEVCTT